MVAKKAVIVVVDARSRAAPLLLDLLFVVVRKSPEVDCKGIMRFVFRLEGNLLYIAAIYNSAEIIRIVTKWLLAQRKVKNEFKSQCFKVEGTAYCTVL